MLLQTILRPFGCLASLVALSESAAISSTTRNFTDVPIINLNDAVDGALNVTAWSLIYSYPLYIFANFAGNVLRSVPINTIYHQRQLSSPDNPGVIKPNIDTLYSRVVLDLSHHDVVLTIPNITDGRYWNYPVYDSFGNVIAAIGNLNNYTGGQYLIRRSDDVLIQPGVQASGNPPHKKYLQHERHHGSSGSNETAYKAIVNLPTTHGTLLIRLFVKENTTEDLNQLHTYQNASFLTSIPRNISAALSPSGNITSLAPNGSLLGLDTPEKLFDFAAKFVPYNQPENYTDRYRVASILGAAGIYGGRYHPLSGVNLTQAALVANASITADLANSSHIRHLGNNWELTIPSYQGNFGTNYGPRAYVAINGYQQQKTDQTLYPGYKNTGFTSSASLSSGQALLLTFSGKPPLKKTGFWSLSIYGADQYLIPNPIDLFEIGDRSSNLTYQHGGLVYGAGANASYDGPFQVLVQNANSAPPANWTGNWLPASDSFSYILRW
ncbi:hypothetical protein D6D24_10008, partial [Aureobasidium pullulans]